MTSAPPVLKIGLAIGHGTGPELADVFVKVFNQLANHCRVRVEINRSQRVYHSYQSLTSISDNLDAIREETAQDAIHYEHFCKDQAAQGTRVIFRTAISAQSLYVVRQHLEAIKVEVFSNSEADVILVRDQAQGFYTGTNVFEADNETVSRTGHFKKGLTERIVRYSLDRARSTWGDDLVIDSVTMVYKYHLFDGLLDVWAKEWSHTYGVQILFIQPDTMNRNILRNGLKGRQLIIASNEYADIMEVLFLDWLGHGVQENTYSENVYLATGSQPLIEYQTLHGSADDLTNKGTVNPTATIKAAAAILERYAGCSGLERTINNTTKTLLKSNVATPNQGGDVSTAAYVDAVLTNFAA